MTSRELDALADPSPLNILRLAYCEVRDLSPLAGLTHLTTLSLRGCGRRIRAGRLRPLAGLPTSPMSGRPEQVGFPVLHSRWVLSPTLLPEWREARCSTEE